MKPVTLKIKIKTLAAEAAIIRHEERKALSEARLSSGVDHRRMIKFCEHVLRRGKPDFNEMDQLLAKGFHEEVTQELASLTDQQKLRAPGQYARFTQLREHRVNQVRKESRASQLAYAFLRGKDYKQVEKDAKRPLYGWEVDSVIRNVKAHRVGVRAHQTLPDLKTAVTSWLVGKDSPFKEVEQQEAA